MCYLGVHGLIRINVDYGIKYLSHLCVTIINQCWMYILYIKTEKESFSPLEDNVIPYLLDNYHPTLNCIRIKRKQEKNLPQFKDITIIFSNEFNLATLIIATFSRARYILKLKLRTFIEIQANYNGIYTSFCVSMMNTRIIFKHFSGIR